MCDPFADIPDATREECDIQTRQWRPKETVGLGDMKKPRRKKTDLNPHEKRWLEGQGYTWARVDKANAWGAVNVDLWGIFDYLAVKPEEAGVLFVQVTDLTNASKRRRKILTAPQTAVLLAAGNRVELHCWHQPKGVGSKWEVRVERIEAIPLDGATNAQTGRQSQSRPPSVDATAPPVVAAGGGKGGRR
jgi:hypothetical protein